MDDSLKKLAAEAERLRNVLPASLADEIRRAGAGSAIADLVKQQRALGSVADAMKQVAEIEKMTKLTVPSMPYLEPFRPPHIPTFEETNHFQSAAVLLRRLADSIRQWRLQLPDGLQPAVVALLNGGVQIDVQSLAQESFHGIRIEGLLADAPCVVLAHQATVQLLCVAQPIEPPARPKRQIGFIIDGERSQA